VCFEQRMINHNTTFFCELIVMCVVGIMV
jgi:hypothetical protein